MARKPTVNDHARANTLTLVGKNIRQRKYLKAMESSPQTFVLGPAGTGKTYVASAFAATQYLRGKIDKIVITRPRVEVDEEWGFLPGSIEQKTAPWAYPVLEVVKEYLGKARYLQAVKDGHVEVVPLAFMRGRTLERAFCLLDEAQNVTVKQMKMFVTRVGTESRVVVNGDLAQRDIPTDSGLAWALNMIARFPTIPAEIVEFTTADVVRSEACAAWIDAMSKTPE